MVLDLAQAEPRMAWVVHGVHAARAGQRQLVGRALRADHLLGRR